MTEQVQPTWAHFRAMAADILGVEPGAVQQDTRLDAFGADSLDQIMLFQDCCDQYGSLPYEAERQFRRPGMTAGEFLRLFREGLGLPGPPLV